MAIALITGTSTGIGLATALALGRAGYRVYATMRNPQRAPELVSIATKEALPIVVVPLDVDDDGSVQRAVTQVQAERGRIDVLVNNAGITPLGSIEERPLPEFRQTMETNFFGAVRCIQAVLPQMREQRSGCIVNISSVAGRVAQAAQGAYAASKFALEAMSEVLAQEVKAFNIRVAIVEPCIIQTAIFDKVRAIPVERRYPQERRLKALFAASLAHPVSATVVGEAIRQIVESDSWQLRYPIGPDATSFLARRAGMSDEAWVAFGAMQDDEAWCARIAQDFGLDVRPYLD
jgi:NAD(P)-dependent dehydrogenase (short-subunit alcohol dehydrogenase family)